MTRAGALVEMTATEFDVLALPHRGAGRRPQPRGHLLARVGPEPPRHAAHHRQLHPAAPREARARPPAATPPPDGARRRLPLRRRSGRRRAPGHPRRRSHGHPGRKRRAATSSCRRTSSRTVARQEDQAERSSAARRPSSLAFYPLDFSPSVPRTRRVLREDFSRAREGRRAGPSASAWTASGTPWRSRSTCKMTTRSRRLPTSGRRRRPADLSLAEQPGITAGDRHRRQAPATSRGIKPSARSPRPATTRSSSKSFASWDQARGPEPPPQLPRDRLRAPDAGRAAPRLARRRHRRRQLVAARPPAAALRASSPRTTRGRCSCRARSTSSATR